MLTLTQLEDLVLEAGIVVPSHRSAGGYSVEEILQAYVGLPTNATFTEYLYKFYLEDEEPNKENGLFSFEEFQKPGTLRDFLYSDYFMLLSFAASVYPLATDRKRLYSRSDNYKTSYANVNLPTGERAYRAALVHFLTGETAVQYKRANYTAMNYTAPEPLALFHTAEDQWEEFDGTFNSALQQHGLWGEVLGADGVPRFFQWEGSFSEILTHLRSVNA